MLLTKKKNHATNLQCYDRRLILLLVHLNNSLYNVSFLGISQQLPYNNWPLAPPSWSNRSLVSRVIFLTRGIFITESTKQGEKHPLACRPRLIMSWFSYTYRRYWSSPSRPGRVETTQYSGFAVTHAGGKKRERTGRLNVMLIAITHFILVWYCPHWFKCCFSKAGAIEVMYIKNTPSLS